MLAYVFWHRPRDEVGVESYERSLIAFHETLAKADLKGFCGSATFRVKGAPWVGLESRGYEDWYLLEGSFALDLLNEVAVSGSRKEPHDSAAGASASGAGGLYRLRSGEPRVVESRFVTWLTKPPGTGYEDFYDRLRSWTDSPGTSLWRRQMVLGPAPEFCLLAPDQLQFPANLGPIAVNRTPIWPVPGA